MSQSIENLSSSSNWQVRSSLDDERGQVNQSKLIDHSLFQKKTIDAQKLLGSLDDDQQGLLPKD